jgi:hypothetical protein
MGAFRSAHLASVVFIVMHSACSYSDEQLGNRIVICNNAYSTALLLAKTSGIGANKSCELRVINELQAGEPSRHLNLQAEMYRMKAKKSKGCVSSQCSLCIVSHKAATLLQNCNAVQSFGFCMTIVIEQASLLRPYSATISAQFADLELIEKPQGDFSPSLMVGLGQSYYDEASCNDSRMCLPMLAENVDASKKVKQCSLDRLVKVTIEGKCYLTAVWFSLRDYLGQLGTHQLGLLLNRLGGSVNEFKTALKTCLSQACLRGHQLPRHQIKQDSSFQPICKDQLIDQVSSPCFARNPPDDTPLPQHKEVILEVVFELPDSSILSLPIPADTPVQGIIAEIKRHIGREVDFQLYHLSRRLDPEKLLSDYIVQSYKTLTLRIAARGGSGDRADRN